MHGGVVSAQVIKNRVRDINCTENYHGGGAETPGECGQSSAAASKHDSRFIGSLFTSKMMQIASESTWCRL